MVTSYLNSSTDGPRTLADKILTKTYLAVYTTDERGVWLDVEAQDLTDRADGELTYGMTLAQLQTRIAAQVEATATN